ncbi:MAG: divalent-cation tolerance protein CutA [Rubripirellula sp.]
MEQTQSLVLVITTVETADDAGVLSRALVGMSLAACVQIDGPIISHYRWAGEVQQSSEFRLMIKSSLSAWPQLRDQIAKLHPYDEPEIIMTIIDDSSEGYRNWVIDQTT